MSTNLPTNPLASDMNPQTGRDEFEKLDPRWKESVTSWAEAAVASSNAATDGVILVQGQEVLPPRKGRRLTGTIYLTDGPGADIIDMEPVVLPPARLQAFRHQPETEASMSQNQPDPAPDLRVIRDESQSMHPAPSFLKKDFSAQPSGGTSFADAMTGLQDMMERHQGPGTDKVLFMGLQEPGEPTEEQKAAVRELLAHHTQQQLQRSPLFVKLAQPGSDEAPQPKGPKPA